MKKEFFSLRQQVFAPLELARQEKKIGKSLDAEVILDWDEPRPIFSSEEQNELKEILGVSSLVIRPRNPNEVFDTVVGQGIELGTRKVFVRVHKAPGQKCERCWHWETDVDTNTLLCGRCVEALKQSKA